MFDSSTDVVFGKAARDDDGDVAFTAGAGMNAIEVTVRYKMNFAFGRIFGFQSKTLSATSLAGLRAAEGMTIHVVGLGGGVDKALLDSIASIGGGRSIYVDADNGSDDYAQELEEVFAERRQKKLGSVCCADPATGRDLPPGLRGIDYSRTLTAFSSMGLAFFANRAFSSSAATSPRRLAPVTSLATTFPA